MGAGGAAVPPQNQKARWSMFAGIVRLLVGGIIVGVVAIVLSMQAKKEIEASGGSQSGAGMAQAGLITGIIGVVLSVVWIPFFFSSF
jgi:hypothetical protein